MHSGLDKRGKLQPPRELTDALHRRKQCGYEAARIQAQLDDVSRVKLPIYSTPEAYQKWRTSARAAMLRYSSEAYQLTEWIEEQYRCGLQLAHDVIKALEQDGVDLEEHEGEALSKIETLLGTINKKQKEKPENGQSIERR